MELLRRHLFFVLCGVAGAAGVALAVTGLRAMPQVLTAMEDASGLYQSLKGLKDNPVNREIIEAEQRRIDLTKEDYADVIAKAKELYRYELLVDHVLPAGNAELRYEFRNKYAAAMRGLMDSLLWGGPPTYSMILEVEERIEQEEFESQQPSVHPDAPEGPPDEGPPQTPAGVLTAVGVRKDAIARASIQRAQQIFCYAVDYEAPDASDRVRSLEFDPYMRDTGGIEAPDLEEIWRAQVRYWIQKDVVEAIAAVNEEAAAKLERDARWVGVMPIKEVISVRVSDEFVPSSGGDGEYIYGYAPGGYGAAFPPGTAETVFTGLGMSPFYDVLQFTVKLIMDQRDIPRLIERLCANRFHAPLRVSYKAVPVNRVMKGKVYGPEPTVNVVMDFETVLLDEVFGPLKPEAPEEEG